VKKNDVVTTLEELQALPAYTIVRLPSGQPARHMGLQDRWELFGTAMKYEAKSSEVWLPATVIWTPEAPSE
jgi:hypothetical protein